MHCHNPRSNPHLQENLSRLNKVLELLTIPFGFGEIFRGIDVWVDGDFEVGYVGDGVGCGVGESLLEEAGDGVFPGEAFGHYFVLSGWMNSLVVKRLPCLLRWFALGVRYGVKRREKKCLFYTLEIATSEKTQEEENERRA